MKEKILFVIFIFFVSINIAHAQPFASAYVMTEDEDDDFKKCNLRNEGLIASAKSTLRYNRIEVSSALPSEIIVYINTAIFPTGGSYCGAGLTLEIFKYGQVSLKKGNVQGKHLLCSNSYVSHGTIQNSQEKLNESVRQILDLCISSIEKKLAR